MVMVVYLVMVYILSHAVEVGSPTNWTRFTKAGFAPGTSQYIYHHKLHHQYHQMLHPILLLNFAPERPQLAFVLNGHGVNTNRCMEWPS